MTLRHVSVFVIAASSLLACAPAQPAHEGHEEGKGEEHEHEHEHESMPATLSAFHDVMAPIFHAAPGPEHVTNTCAKATELHDKAVAIEADPDHAAWKEKATALVAATTALSTECEKEGRPHVEDALVEVHTRFHAVMESAEH